MAVLRSGGSKNMNYPRFLDQLRLEFSGVRGNFAHALLRAVVRTGDIQTAQALYLAEGGLLTRSVGFLQHLVDKVLNGLPIQPVGFGLVAVPESGLADIPTHPPQLL